MSRSNRGRGRGRGRGNTSNAHIHKEISKECTMQVFKPPLRVPTVNAGFVFPLKISVGFHAVTPGTLSQTFRVEDLVLAVCKLVNLPSVFCTNIQLRILSAMSYATVDAFSAATKAVIAMTAQAIDPLTQIKGKKEGAFSEIDDPARIGFHFPISTRSTWFGWDGVSSTSAQFMEIGVDVDCYVNLVTEIVVSIMK